MTRVRNLERGTVLAEQLESADSLWAKFRGLMGRAALADGAGLWLAGSNGIHGGIGSIFVAFIGACALLFIMQALGVTKRRR